MLVDTHCHLDFPDFEEDLDDVIARAEAAGVSEMVTICTHVTKFDRVRAIAERYPNVYCTVGIHPHNADGEPATRAARLMELADDPKVIGFGETGLDYFYDHSDRETQKAAFVEHLIAAREAQLPVVVHTRDAEEDTLDLLREEHAVGPFPGVIHCFSASRGFAEAAVELGLYISFSGILTFKKAQAIREVAEALPLDRLLVETDSPYLAPVPKRGKRNEPAFTAHTAALLAEVKGVSFEELAETTTTNFRTLFSKAGKG